MDIILDADGVLLDFVAQFCRFVREQHGIVAAVPYADELCYDMSTMFPGLGWPAIRQLIVDMSHNATYFATIPLIPGALAAVAELRRLLPDARLVCISSCGSHPASAALRLRNLAAFELDEVVTLPLGASKVEAMSGFRPGCWLIDDLPANVAAAEAVGLRGILFTAPFNRSDAAAYRAEDWPEALTHVAATRGLSWAA